MTDLPGDPNWLLATVAQSSAILIGLLGFFVLSRRASFLNEQRSLQTRRRQIELILSSRASRGSEVPDGEAPVGSRWDRDQVEALEAERRVLDEALDRLGTTPGVLPGLLVLCYLAGVGILLPLILMPARTGAFDPAAVWSVGGLQLSGLGWKRMVVGGFAGGLLVALGQIAWTTLRKVPAAPRNQ